MDSKLPDEVIAELEGFFTDPAGSRVLVPVAHSFSTPMVQGVAPTTKERLSGFGSRASLLIIDGSPSMEPVKDELRNGFNDFFVPAVLGARGDDLAALRFGGVVFSSGSPVQIWEGVDDQQRTVFFHPIDLLPKLTVTDYDPSQGIGTALHLAILEGTALVLSYAAGLQAETGTDVDVDVMILSDGRNNESPLNPKVVKDMIQKSDRSRIRFSALYFQTNPNDGFNPEKYFVEDLGFDVEHVKSFAMVPDETPEQRNRRFRRMLGVMSEVVASRGMTVVNAAAAVEDDEELA